MHPVPRLSVMDAKRFGLEARNGDGSIFVCPDMNLLMRPGRLRSRYPKKLPTRLTLTKKGRRVFMMTWQRPQG
jgi:hypothetical protein